MGLRDEDRPRKVSLSEFERGGVLSRRVKNCVFGVFHGENFNG